MLVSTREMLKKAYDGRYAVAAINTQGGTYDIIRAVCLAAEELKAPVILAHYLSTGMYSGHDFFYEVAKWMANKVSIPVAIHLDHGDTVENCKICADLGFTSIMYDGSSLPVEKNAENTNAVIQYCREKDIPVEAEIGEIGRIDTYGMNFNMTNIADPDAVKAYLDMCSPDSLAVGIGNAHGFYKTEPEIHLEVLDKVREFTDIPFVLHGCTGMNEQMVKKSLEYGVSKINFGTQVRHNYVSYIREACEMDFQDHVWKMSQYAEKKLREDIKEIICLAGSEGKA